MWPVIIIQYSIAVSNWMKDHKVKALGMPRFIAAGMHDRNNVKYRFMIMERFGTDLQKLFEENKKSFPHKAVLQLAVRVVSLRLNQVHSDGCSHAVSKQEAVMLRMSTPNFA